MKLVPTTNDGNPSGFLAFCPACDSHHHFAVPGWTFNGDMERPTFSPSMLVRYGVVNEPTKRSCHSFLRDGQWQYLSDSTHEFAGKTVDVPDIEDVRKLRDEQRAKLFGEAP